MPSKTKTTAAADKAAQPHIPAELLDQLVTGPMTAGQVQGLFDQFKKAVLERALAGEMSHHLVSTGVEKRCFLGVKARFESFGASGIFIKGPLPGRRRPPRVMHVFMHNPL